MHNTSKEKDEHMIRTVEALIANLKDKEKVYIYGAGKCAQMVCEVLKQANIDVDAILVQDREKNPDEVSGIPVWCHNEEQIKKDTSTIFVAVANSGQHRAIMDNLLLSGFCKIMFPASDFYLELCSNRIYHFFNQLDSKYEIKDNYRNIEIAHYLLCINNANKARIHFRIPIKSGAPYLSKVSYLFQNDTFFDSFEEQYGKYHFLPYVEGQGKKVEVDKRKISMYMSRCHADSLLFETPEANWLIPIQGGAALTDMEVCELKDNTGDNRSGRNKNYSEGSSLYWIWKNTGNQDYVGLCHYKRRLAVSEESFQYIMENSVDVITTIPVFVAETMKPFFVGPFLMKNDWKVFMEAIHQVDAAIYETAREYEVSRFYIPCNTFLMKRALFDEFCTFAFSVIDIVEAFYEQKGIERADRYVGYLIENLLSIYLMHYHKKFIIAYTDMEYLL